MTTTYKVYHLNHTRIAEELWEEKTEDMLYELTRGRPVKLADAIVSVGKAAAGGLYDHVADVETDNEDGAFAATQSIERTWRDNPGVTAPKAARSTMVGDLIATPDGRILFVRGVGFSEIPRDRWHLRIPGEPGAGIPAVDELCKDDAAVLAIINYDVDLTDQVHSIDLARSVAESDGGTLARPEFCLAHPFEVLPCGLHTDSTDS